MKDMIRNTDSGELIDSDIGVNDNTKSAYPVNIGRSYCCRFPEKSSGKNRSFCRVYCKSLYYLSSMRAHVCNYSYMTVITSLEVISIMLYLAIILKFRENSL